MNVLGTTKHSLCSFINTSLTIRLYCIAQLVHSTTAPSNVTAGIILPAALLSRVHSSVCAMSGLMRLMRDPVSWHHWDTYQVAVALLWLPPGCPFVAWCVYAGHKLMGKAAITSGLHLGRSEVLRSLRHYWWAQSQGQGHHTNNHLEEERKKRTYLTICLEKMINGYCQTNNGTISEGKLGKFLRNGLELGVCIYMGFSECRDTMKWLKAVVM